MAVSVYIGRLFRFSLGIVLGEFVIGSFWSLLAIALDQPMYRFLF